VPKVTVDIDARNNTQKAFNAVEKSTDKLKKSFGGLKTAIVGALGVAGLGAMTKELLSSGDALAKTSAKLGLSTDALQKYRFAAEQSGIQTRTFDIALQRMTRRVAEARQGSGEAKKALEEMGISLSDSGGKAKSTETIFGEVADKMQGMESQSDKVRLAFKLFDAEGVSLVNMMQQGSGAIQEMGDELESVGGILNSETLASFEQFNDLTNKIWVALRGAFAKILAGIIPQITSMGVAFDGFGDVAKKVAEVIATVVRIFKEMFNIQKLIIRQIIDGLGGAWDVVTKKIMFFISKIPFFGKSIKTTNKDVEAAQDKLSKSMSKNWESFKSGRKEIKNSYAEAIKQINGITTAVSVSNKELKKTTEIVKKDAHVFIDTFGEMKASAVALKGVDIGEVFSDGKAEIALMSTEFDKMAEKAPMLGTDIGEIFKEPWLFSDRYWRHVRSETQKFWGITNDEVSAFKTNLETVKGVMSSLWEGSGAAGFFDQFGGDIMGAGGKSGARAQNIISKTMEGKNPQEMVANGLMALVLSNEKVQEALGKVFDALFELIDPIIDTLAPVLEVLVEVLRELKPLLEILIPPIRAMLAPIKTMLTWLKPIAAGISTLSNNLSNVSGSLGAVSDGLGNMIGVFDTVEDIFADTFGEDSPPVKAMKALMSPLHFLKNAVDGLADPLKALKAALESGQNIGQRSGINIGRQLGFQHGGIAPGNRDILVGEAGPEILRTPAGGASITPFHELGGVIINVYSDVGRKISEAEAGIRIEIEDRANRNNQFPALLAA
jgi:hypothetical protein